MTPVMKSAELPGCRGQHVAFAAAANVNTQPVTCIFLMFSEQPHSRCA